MNSVLLFIPELLSKDVDSFITKLIIVICAWVAVLIAMLVDLHYGLKKAKQIGEHRTSEGFRRSVTKFKDYYASLLFAILFDALLSVFTYYLPYPLSVTPPITIVAALGLILTEYKSVRENADQKLRRKLNSSFADLAELYMSLRKEGITEQFIDFIKTKETEKVETTVPNQNNINSTNNDSL